MLFAQSSIAAELTTGAILGSVRSITGSPVSGAGVTATSPSGRYSAAADSSGRFVIMGVVPDTYTVTASARGYQPASDVVVVLPTERERIAFVLRPQIREIVRVEAKGEAFSVGRTSETFTVAGNVAQATATSESSSGLANYTQGTVQGAIAASRAYSSDSFANVIVRGGKVQDTVSTSTRFRYRKGLIAEPGGNIVGAQLGTTGIASTTLTVGELQQREPECARWSRQRDSGNRYLSRARRLRIADGIGAQFGEVEIERARATPDLRWRYALATMQSARTFRTATARRSIRPRWGRTAWHCRAARSRRGPGTSTSSPPAERLFRNLAHRRCDVRSVQYAVCRRTMGDVQRYDGRLSRRARRIPIHKSIRPHAHAARTSPASFNGFTTGSHSRWDARTSINPNRRDRERTVLGRSLVSRRRHLALVAAKSAPGRGRLRFRRSGRREPRHPRRRTVLGKRQQSRSIIPPQTKRSSQTRA